jgi:hypothetical protein
MHALGRRTVAIAASGGLALALLTGTVFGADQSTSHDWPYASSGPVPVLAAVGDVSCEPDDPGNATNPTAVKCDGAGIGGYAAQYATADQIEGMHPDLVALLGDEQYQVGKLSDFMSSFDKTYGAFKFLQRPAPGNHEYYAYTKHGDNEAAQNGAGYFAYYNGTDASGNIRPQGQAGDYNQGWYSYNLGDWHIISLNAECGSAAFGNNCDPTTGVLAQETQWLAKDLAANHNACTLAYWHQPTFSATGSAGDPPYAAFASTEGGAADAWWKLLYQNGADLVLNGHEHVYARFQPMNPSGQVDTHKGITQFTVGTGGESLDTLSASSSLQTAHVVTGEDTAYGVLKLSLGRNGYSYNFQPVLAGPGQDPSVLNYTDSGTGRCHGPEGHGR